MPPLTGTSLLTYRTTFHPLALTMNEATELTIGSGEERRNVDIHLRRTQANKISGTLAGPDGPASFVAVRLVATRVGDLYNDRDAETALTVTDASGAFTFLGVPGGHYLLKAYVIREPGRNPPPFSTTGLQWWAQTSVSVDDTDVNLPPLTLRSPPTVSGEVVFDGSDELAGGAVPINVSLGFVGPTPIPPPRTATSHSGRRFAMTGLIAGRYQILTNTWNSWRVRGITADGRDITGTPIDLTDRDPATVKITLARVSR